MEDNGELIGIDRLGNEYYYGDRLTVQMTEKLAQSFPNGRVIGGKCYKVRFKETGKSSYVCFNEEGRAFCEFNGLADSDRTDMYFFIEATRMDDKDNVINMAKARKGIED